MFVSCLDILFFTSRLHLFIMFAGLADPSLKGSDESTRCGTSEGSEPEDSGEWSEVERIEQPPQQEQNHGGEEPNRAEEEANQNEPERGEEAPPPLRLDARRDWAGRARPVAGVRSTSSIAASAATSRANRPAAASLLISTTFTATVSPDLWSRARYTVPLPPLPAVARIRKRPAITRPVSDDESSIRTPRA